MNNIPGPLRAELAEDPYYKICARVDFDCSGRITWEHAHYYAGKQIQERWAIIPLCVYHHLGPGLNKELNQAIALARASDEDLAKYPRGNWQQMKSYLFKKYEI